MPDAVIGGMQDRFMGLSAIDAFLQRVDVLDQRCQGLTDGIRQAAVFQIDLLIGGVDGVFA
jgi:hypothetical protein